jgi:hypothetical protein
MPLAAMITMGPRRSLSCFDSSGVSTDLNGTGHGVAFGRREAQLPHVLPVHPGGAGRHRAVQVDGQVLDRAAGLEQVDAVHQRLRAAHRERGYHHRAAARGRALDDVRQLPHHVAALVQAVAVSRARPAISPRPTPIPEPR